MSKEIYIVCGADDNYVIPLSITLYSLCINLNHGWSLQVFVIDGGITAENKRRVERVVESSPAPIRLQWVAVETESIEDLPTHEWINTSTYLRLFIPEIVPDHLEKVIYLDSDLQVEASISSLWTQKINETPLRAVQAYGTPYVSSPLGIDGYEQLGLSPKTPYFNAGVLLINLDKWRNNNVSQRVVQYLRSRGEQVQMVDQEGLNAVLADDWKPLDLKWNVMSHLVNFDDWKDSPFKERVRSRRKKLWQDAYIYHFAGGSKPWQIGCIHPAQLEWITYLWKSGWFTPTERIRWFGEWFARYYWWRVKKRLGFIS